MLQRRDLVLTVLIQGVGALATMAVTGVVAARFGPAGQGFWASFKATLDWVSVAAAYGFPVGFPFLVNVRRVSDVRLLGFSIRYGLALIPAIAILIGLAYATGVIHPASPTPRLELAAITLSASALAVQAMVRGLSLATASTSIFNVVTAIPPIALLLAVAAWPAGSELSLMKAATLAALGSLALCLVLWWRRRTPPADATEPVARRELLSLGGWNFVVAVAIVSIPACTFQILGMAGVSRREIGWLSIAILVQGGLLTPANMIGPVLYNAWTRYGDPLQRRHSFSHIHRYALALSSAASLVTALALYVASPWLAAHDFGPAVPLAWILLAAVPLGYSSRMMANVLLASGQARLFAISTIVRLAAVVAILLVTTAPTPHTAAIAWVVGEVAALLVSAMAIVGSLNWSWPDTLGFRVSRESA